MIQYFTGSNLILVNDTEHYSDQRADIIIHGRSDRFLSSILAECDK